MFHYSMDFYHRDTFRRWNILSNSLIFDQYHDHIQRICLNIVSDNIQFETKRGWGIIRRPIGNNFIWRRETELDCLEYETIIKKKESERRQKRKR